MSEGNAQEFSGGFAETLGIEYTLVEPGRVEAVMPITAAISQPFGFVHGGATISLLETVASKGALGSCGSDEEIPFGFEVSVRHRKSGRAGHIRAVATLDHEEESHGRAGGTKQYWNVAAYDDAGDVMSGGVIVMRVVSRERLGR